MKKKARRVSVIKKPGSKSKNPLKWFLGASLFITVALILLRIYYPPQAAEIFAVTEPLLTYGDTTITGTLKQGEGSFILETNNYQVVELDLKDLTKYVGQPVTATGTLTLDDRGNNVMTVTELTVGNI